MTTKVTVTHSQPDYPSEVEVGTYFTGSHDPHYSVRLKSGDSAEVYIHSGCHLIIKEVLISYVQNSQPVSV